MNQEKYKNRYNKDQLWALVLIYHSIHEVELAHEPQHSLSHVLLDDTSIIFSFAGTSMNQNLKARREHGNLNLYMHVLEQPKIYITRDFVMRR